MTAPTLFDQPTACTHGRMPDEKCPWCEMPPFQGHSITSLEAAAAIRPAALVLREQVFACIVVHGPVTDEQIAELTGLAPNTARPRRVELMDAGRIRAEGTLTTHSGRKARAWVAA